MLKRPKIIFILIFIIFIAFLSLPLQISRSIKIELVDFFSPILGFTGKISDKIIAVISRTGQVFNAVSENAELRRKNAELTGKVNVLKEAELENKRLAELLGLSKSLQFGTTACRVIGRDPGTWFKTIIIDKGSKDGIKINAGVLNKEGAVGRVIACGEKSSTVLLITDADSSIGALIQNNRIEGLVEGQGTNKCILNYLPKKTEVSAGDTVITSGLSTIFPKGIIIGNVVSVDMDSQGLYQVAKIELAADINKLEEVLVITKKN